jgi:homotetrameric cytidine deaminase
MNDAMDPELLARLKQVRERAYAPYSGFRVAAAVESEDGTIFFGCNVETAHYKSVCAEASALSAMVTAGQRRAARTWILADGDRPCPPCGDCRQRLHEFCDQSVPVYLLDATGRVARRATVGELLPGAFTGVPPKAR